MARSTHVYVILRPTLGNDPVVATFTVKHECESYIRDSKDLWKRDWIVRRYRDGPSLWRPDEPSTLVTFDFTN